MRDMTTALSHHSELTRVHVCVYRGIWYVTRTIEHMIVAAN
jgi:hypothetical protein